MNSSDITSFERALRDHLKAAKTSQAPDYTLDYGYEGGDSSIEEVNFVSPGLSSPIPGESSSGYNEPKEPFGDTFDALYQLSDGEEHSRHTDR